MAEHKQHPTYNPGGRLSSSLMPSHMTASANPPVQTFDSRSPTCTTTWKCKGTLPCIVGIARYWGPLFPKSAWGILPTSNYTSDSVSGTKGKAWTLLCWNGAKQTLNLSVPCDFNHCKCTVTPPYSAILVNNGEDGKWLCQWTLFLISSRSEIMSQRTM
jgi:hypothetical protein